jgi:hypothetical protein
LFAADSSPEETAALIERAAECLVGKAPKPAQEAEPCDLAIDRFALFVAQRLMKPAIRPEFLHFCRSPF